jgi:hypothetical protein
LVACLTNINKSSPARQALPSGPFRNLYAYRVVAALKIWTGGRKYFFVWLIGPIRVFFLIRVYIAYTTTTPMQYEDDQKHYLLAKMLAYLVIPVLCFLLVLMGVLIVYMYKL